MAALISSRHAEVGAAVFFWFVTAICLMAAALAREA